MLKSYTSGANNWDMLAYVGNALDHGQPAAELHHQVYTLAATSLPAGAYAELTGGGSSPEYRSALLSDPVAFSKTRVLFQQRVLYIWAIRGLVGLGFDPFDASAAIGPSEHWESALYYCGGSLPMCPAGAWRLALCRSFMRYSCMKSPIEYA